jgi:hypothetical protein
MGTLSWLLSRESIIGIAILGGATSIVAMALRAFGHSDPALAAWLDRVAYAFMGISVALFILSGVVGVRQA